MVAVQSALKKAQDVLKKAVTESELKEKTDLGENEKLILLRLELVEMALSSQQCPVRILSSSSSLACFSKAFGLSVYIGSSFVSMVTNCK